MTSASRSRWFGPRNGICLVISRLDELRVLPASPLGLSYIGSVISSVSPASLLALLSLSKNDMLRAVFLGFSISVSIVGGLS